MLPFSRSVEVKIGLTLMAIAGYNPEEVAFGLECLLTQVELHNQVYEYAPIRRY
jgi:translation elongation factor EF-1beta